MKKSAKVLSVLTATIMAFSLCASPFTVQTVQAAAKGKVKKVTISNLPANTLTLKKGKKFTLKTRVTVTGKASKSVTFKSSNKKIVKVTSKGKLTAKKKGKATITITSKANKKKKAKIKVTVGTPVSQIKLSDTKLTLSVKAKKQITATVAPQNASNSAIIWSSSNTKIATVSKGTITAIATGTATITALAADGSGKKATVQVTVGPSVSAINLSETKKSMVVGQTSQLTATVLPTNATTKTLKWTSSNNGIVSVDNNGALKALKAGSATITAEATDGSGKKASCNVTAIKPVTVVSSRFLSRHMLHIKLSESAKLEMDAFSFLVKIKSSGQYRTEAPIESIRTADQQNYYISFDTRFTIGTYMQTTLKGLRGNPTCVFETICKPQKDVTENYDTWNTTVNQSIHHIIELYGVGYSSVKVTGLPNSIYYTVDPDDYGNSVVTLNGNCTQVGIHPYTISYTDEIGNSYITHAQLIVCDSDSLFAYTAEPLVSNGYRRINIAKGANLTNVSLTITGEDYGLTVSSLGKTSFELHGHLSDRKSGKYPLTFHVEANKGEDIVTYDYTTTIEVVEYIVLSGAVTGLDNIPLEQVRVSVVNLSNDSTTRNAFSDSNNYVFTDSDGTYSISIPAGEYYICVSHPLTKIYSNAEFKIEKSKNMNFQAQLLTLDTVLNDVSLYPSSFWTDENGNPTIYSENKLIVQPGKHTYKTLSSREEKLYNPCMFTISGDFSTKTKSVDIKKEKKSTLGTPLNLEKPLTEKLDSVYFSFHPFTPTEDGTYYFYTTKSNTDRYISIVMADAQEEIQCHSFADYITFNLKKGETYYFSVGSYPYELYFNSFIYDFDNLKRDNESTVSFVISKKLPTNR